jgi:hypothetical protein
MKRIMKRNWCVAQGVPTVALVSAGLLILAAAIMGTEARAAHASKIETLYGHEIVFKVLRDGEPLGEHVVRFSAGASELRVDIRSKLEVKFLAWTAYRFEYRSNALWGHDGLELLEATSDDNGDVSVVTLRRAGDRYRIEGPGGVAESLNPIYPTNHWNVGVVGSVKVLNTITGRLNAVELVDAGVEEILAEGRKIEARRFVYSGELETEVWYDGQGRWVGMRFKGKDGSTIRYICTKCLGPERGASK